MVQFIAYYISYTCIKLYNIKPVTFPSRCRSHYLKFTPSSTSVFFICYYYVYFLFFIKVLFFVNNKQYGQYMFPTPVLIDTVGAEIKVELNSKENNNKKRSKHRSPY